MEKNVGFLVNMAYGLTCGDAGESDDGDDEEEEEADRDEDDRTADDEETAMATAGGAPLLIAVAAREEKASDAGNSKQAEEGGCCSDEGSGLETELEGGDDVVAAVAPSGMYGRDWDCCKEQFDYFEGSLKAFAICGKACARARQDRVDDILTTRCTTRGVGPLQKLFAGNRGLKEALVVIAMGGGLVAALVQVVR